jgi:hypothetical protein
VLLPLSIAVVIVTAIGILLAQELGNAFVWSIPVLSLLAGLLAIVALNRALKRTVKHA